MTEEWRPVVGFEGIYAVSNRGNVKRVAAGQGARIGMLKPQWNTHGYLHVQLCRNGRAVQVGIHRLVAGAFLGPMTAGIEVNHRNGIKHDNRVKNLELVTRSQNTVHAHRILGARNGTRRGEACNTSKLTAAQVRDIRQRFADGAKQVALAKEFNVSRDNIYKIVIRRYWKHID